jgi:hypothetical protein
MSQPGVGDDIEDVCARCGENWHVVMAKMGDRIAKVVCKRCGGQHNYRSTDNKPPQAPGATPSGPRRPPARRKAAAKDREIVPQVTAPPFDPGKPPRSYSAGTTYAISERIDHPAFGVGVVAALPGPGKVDVVFPNGARTLACAKTSSALERPVPAAHVPISDRPPDASLASPAPADRSDES